MIKGLVIFLLMGIFIISFSESVFAVPNITFASGIITDGQSVVISGNGFGINSLDIEWLGDNIENGIDGGVFSKTGWSSRPAADDSAGTYYNDAQAHSGSQSLMIDYAKDVSNKYAGYFTYNRGTPMDKVYFSWWVRAQLNVGSWPTLAQWKIFRIQRGDSPVDNNMQPGFLQSNRNTLGYEATLMPTTTTSEWLCTQPCDEKNPGTIYLNENYVPGSPVNREIWVRMEYYIEESGKNLYDGKFIYWFHKPGLSITKAIDYDTLITRGTDDYLNYIIFGHFAGDNSSFDLTTWWDDVYVQVGTQARIELCDSSTWSARTHCEIQIPTTWLDGSITINVNQGSFIDGEDVYLFVVDENGDASNGFLVTLGDGLSNCSSADDDENGSVSITELINYISQWKAGNVVIGDLITAIGEWKNGC